MRLAPGQHYAPRSAAMTKAGRKASARKAGEGRVGQAAEEAVMNKKSKADAHDGRLGAFILGGPVQRLPRRALHRSPRRRVRTGPVGRDHGVARERRPPRSGRPQASQ